MSTASSPWTSTCFPWEQLAEARVEPLIAYRGAVPPQMARLTVRHPFYTWWWIRRGRAEVTVGDQTVRARPGSWVLIPAGRTRTHRLAASTELVSLNFHARWPQGGSLLDVPRVVVQPHDTPTGLTAAAETVCRLLEHEPGGDRRSLRARRLRLGDALELQEQLLRFVRLLFEHLAAQHGAAVAAAGSRDARLDRVVADLRHQPAAGPLPWARWRRELGLGRSQLDRLARQHLAQSLRSYRDWLLMEEISLRLGAATRSVKELAHDLRFVDSAHFCRWVRRHSGHSPTHLKRVSF